MAKLIASPPVTGLPLSAGNTALSLIDPGAITALAPFNGQDQALSKALAAAHGVGFPAPGQSLSSDDTRCIWTGRSQAMLLGPAAGDDLAKLAAVTDQTDAWAVFRLQGADARAVLARLVPIDLHPALFPEGATARTLMLHMVCSLTRTGAEAYDIMVFRSMAETAVHDLSTAMKSVAAQA